MFNNVTDYIGGPILFRIFIRQSLNLNGLHMQNERIYINLFGWDSQVKKGLRALNVVRAHVINSFKGEKDD